ncbi:hypothetical protein TPA0910_87670 [Streptomyces hygroscopicus subsp. sporocinereus]|uniref:Restriction endonuclease type IV Mrr domain-containing protein n=1 Tax=Streptomyces hygroscopicus TaxID=1912 RepID=A0ABQ3UFJ4_STRHY|nr:restriction endonuclease [Streptomyces hygroscopicus]GHJ34334.1 hypothetical protein TPA0910_87670 [Streptomyces hygroscopicus]
MSRTARRRTGRLHLSLTGWALTLFALYICARTWPIQTAGITTALALTGIATVRRRSRSRSVRGRSPIALRARLARWIPRPRAARPADLGAYLALDPTGFEHAIADLARRAPHVYSAVRQGGANDRAADVLVSLRDGRRIVIQCKRYQPRKAVDAETVYSLNGTYAAWHHANAAVIVTTSRFTASARDFAHGVGIRLVDGPGLIDWTHGGPPPWA